MSNKLGQESAFPEPFVNDPHLAICHTKGMSKRFYAACAAMSGILANSDIMNRYSSMEDFTKDCYYHADELLRLENI